VSPGAISYGRYSSTTGRRSAMRVAYMVGWSLRLQRGSPTAMLTLAVKYGSSLLSGLSTAITTV
jgi:hypothetical protein